MTVAYPETVPIDFFGKSGGVWGVGCGVWGKIETGCNLTATSSGLTQELSQTLLPLCPLRPLRFVSSLFCVLIMPNKKQPQY
ncbi:hypothetical protein NIES4074_11240 [Cylindrospermum sp. NIES-4074]|nr:hypothetical protein NIES4074_11240 [Cylindrospermum sp. NIES-4074]